jgi:type 1 glutamine amidotransferase
MVAAIFAAGPAVVHLPHSTAQVQKTTPSTERHEAGASTKHSRRQMIVKQPTGSQLMVKRQLALLSASALLLAPLAWGADNTAPAGFVSLFNGKDLAGWKVPAGDNGHWKVIDGAIDYDAQSQAVGDKTLWSDRAYGDFILQADWRVKQAPFINHRVPYILPDGTHARDIRGQEMRLALPDADSGVFLRGNGRFQVNIWCWPIGSGELYSIRTDPNSSPGLRVAATPRTQADKPVGEWNHFEITVRGKTIAVVLNGQNVIPGATIPDLPKRGRLALQHHGGKNHNGAWNGPPSLVQFKNIYIKELDAPDTITRPAGPGRPRPDFDAVRGLVITGGHDHETSFYSLFDGYKDLARLPVTSSTMAFQNDLRGKYDVLIMYDFTRDLDQTGKKNLRDFVESGKGIVVLHHALLNYQEWPWWYEDVVGGRYRLKRDGTIPSSTVKNDQQILVTPKGEDPITAGIDPFLVVDETYKGMYISPRVRPLLTTDNPNSDRFLAWIGPCATSRVVAIQLGHGPTIFGHPSYRALVHNAILWSAGRIK